MFVLYKLLLFTYILLNQNHSKWLEDKVVEQMQDDVAKEEHATFFPYRGPLEED